jgi:AraC family transcriptional regulator
MNRGRRRVTTAIGRAPGVEVFGGLEQFERRGQIGDIGYCIAGAKPYALEFNNDSDVICLLLGDIISETKFEDGRAAPLLFAGRSSAFHPRGGNVRVRADQVRHGFVAFSYPRQFEDGFDDDIDISRMRQAGSRNNIRKSAIGGLARYALSRLRSGDGFGTFELKHLATLLYLETVRSLGVTRGDRRSGLSDRQFKAICDFIEAELGNEMSCAGIAAAANVPLRVVFDGMRVRTGMSPYRFVMERRVERACDLLRTSPAPISEIALVCGFSSQQHLTSTLSSKLGKTPGKIRMNG